MYAASFGREARIGLLLCRCIESQYGDKKLYGQPEPGAPLREVAEGALQKVTATAEQALGSTPVSFEENRRVVMMPKPTEHRSTERQSQQHH